jgi:hypothetical protein
MTPPSNQIFFSLYCPSSLSEIQCIFDNFIAAPNHGKPTLCIDHRQHPLNAVEETSVSDKLTMARDVWTIESVEECMRDLHPPLLMNVEDHNNEAPHDARHPLRGNWGSTPSFLPRVDRDWLLDGIAGWSADQDQRESTDLESQLYTSEVEFIAQIEAMLLACDTNVTRGEDTTPSDFELDKDETRSADDCEVNCESDEDEFGDFQAAPSTCEQREEMIDGLAMQLLSPSPASPPQYDAEETAHEGTTDRMKKSAPEGASTPVLVEQVNSILGRWGAGNTMATPNDSSGEGTCDTGQLLEISSAFLSAFEEKKDESVEIETSTKDSPLPLCFPSTSKQEEGLTGIERYPGNDDADSDKDCDDSCPLVGRSTAPSAGDSDESSRIFVEPTIPESIEAPCIHSSNGAVSGYDDGDSCVPRISLRLPVEDLTTLEGRFTRRRQKVTTTDAPATPGGAVPNLPPFYYHSDVDDTVHVLRLLPWGYLEREDERMLWDEMIESRLRHLDTTLSDVQAHILSSLPIQDLASANSLVHECQLHLDLALMYHERASEGLNEILEHPDDSVELWHQRDTCRELQAVLERVRLLYCERDKLNSRIDNFDVVKSCCVDTYSALSEDAGRLLSDAKAPPISELRCLDGLRTSLQLFPRRFWKRLISLNQAMIIRACQSGTLEVKQYLILLQHVKDVQRACASDVSIDFHQEWSRSLRGTLCVAADQALVNALFDCDGDCEEPSVGDCVQDLRREFDRAPDDPTNLRAIARHLVIIRFQMSRTNLAYICHDLLRRLWNLLRTQEQLTTCLNHNDGDAGFSDIEIGRSRSCKLMQAIHSDLQQLRQFIWHHCEGTLLRLLREYLSLSTACNLFDGRDDKLWSQDLQCLSQVLALADHFLSLRSLFFEKPEITRNELSDKQSSELHEGLKDLFLRHLRSVHVEAMNSTGRVLCNETWIFESMELSTVENEDNVDAILESLIILLYKLGPPSPAHFPTKPSRAESHPWQSNPFGSTLDAFQARLLVSDASISSTIGCATARELGHLLPSALVSSCLEIQDGTLRLLAPRCITDGLLRWTARLLCIMKNLPLVVEEASSVLADLLDLHLTTIFRLCCGSAKSERILLGSVKPSPYINMKSDLNVRSPPHRVTTPGSPLFSSLRKGSLPAQTRGIARSSRAVLPSALDAEICAPVLKDLPQVLRLRMFLLRAQDSLQDVVNLDKVESWLTDPRQAPDDSFEEHCCGVSTVLEKRTCALWSCYVVALVAAAGLRHACRSVQMPLYLDHHSGEGLSLLRCYVWSLLDITPVLTTTASRFVCARAIGGSDIVKNILLLDSKWNERELHEHPNDFVYDVSEKMALVWGYLCLSRKLPVAARNAVWENMVHGAYLSVLDGFARVSCSSTEGRSLMMLDLASLSSELAASAVEERLEGRSMVVPSPPPISSNGRMRPYDYVETYIKIVYFPKDDAVTWIDQKYSTYQLNHMLSLVKEISGVNEEQQLADHVKDLYAKAECAVVGYASNGA